MSCAFKYELLVRSLLTQLCHPPSSVMDNIEGVVNVIANTLENLIVGMPVDEQEDVVNELLGILSSYIDVLPPNIIRTLRGSVE